MILSAIACPTFILAFSLADPLILWGLLLLAVPWLLHLLTKRQYRSTEWAAMRFLLEAMRKNSRRIRIEHLILLIVRTTLLGLIVFGLARPLWTASGPLLGGYEPVHRIIVLDTSFSMGLEQTPATLFTKAQQSARELVTNSKQGDAFQLLQLSQAVSSPIIAEPAFRKEDVLNELDRLKVTAGGASLIPTLEAIAPLLEQLPQLSRKRIYLISDFQKTTWRSDGAEGDRASQLLGELSKKARLVLLDVGVQDTSNQTLASLSVSEKLLTPDQDIEVRGTIRASGPQRESTPIVELWSDGLLAAQQPVTLSSNAEATFAFPHRFSTGGSHRLRVKIPDDRLPIDNERTLAVQVKSEIRVLSVNGKPPGDPRDSAVYYLQLALSPGETPGSSHGLIHPQVIQSAELRNYDLRNYDAVFFCNVPTFDDSEVLAIEQYLNAGGIVIWSLGDRVQSAEYNRLFSQPGKVLLPAPLEERRGDHVRKQEVFNISTTDLAHPALKIFQGNPAAGLGTTPVFEYFRVGKSPDDKNPSQTVLSLVNGDPLLIERTVGLGRSLLYTSTFDESWSNFAVWPSFLPFVQELVRYTVAANAPPQDLELYQTAVIPNSGDARLQIRKPDGNLIPLETNPSATGPLLLSGVDLPGFYEVLTPSNEQKYLLSANVPVEEGNLEKLTRAELAQGLLSSSEFEYQTELQTDQPIVGKAVTQTVEPARWLILAGLYLLFVELLMAWNFRAGLALLFPPLIPFWMVRRLKSG